MTAPRTPLTPVQEAEGIRQVVGVLRRMEQRFDDGTWTTGLRFGHRGSNCLLGGIDEATIWALPGVREEVVDRLADHLPRGFQTMARFRPRVALALYGRTVGGRLGALELVRAALADLGLGHQPRRTWPAATGGRGYRQAA